jgi:hypothetical protein
MRDLVDDVQLLPGVSVARRTTTTDLDGDLVDLVEDIDTGNVNTIALNDVNELVGRCIAAERHVGVVNAVLACGDQKPNQPRE